MNGKGLLSVDEVTGRTETSENIVNFVLERSFIEIYNLHMQEFLCY